MNRLLNKQEPGNENTDVFFIHNTWLRTLSPHHPLIVSLNKIGIFRGNRFIVSKHEDLPVAKELIRMHLKNK